MTAQAPPRPQLMPQPGPQYAFLNTRADIAIYGGARGGGKSWALCFEPVRHTGNPKFGAVIFRSTYKQIDNEGGLWDKSEEIYPLIGAKPVKSKLSWVFRSGAKITFSYLQFDKDIDNWQGLELPYIGFDELTHFSRKMFFSLMLSNRSTSGIKPYIRATCNPDPESWLVDFLGWWIGDDGFPIKERAGVLRYFVVVADEVIWGDSKEELLERTGHITVNGRPLMPKSVTFIPASLYDNKILMLADPQYEANLLAMNDVERKRFLLGNWKVKAEAGDNFHRDWWNLVDPQMVPLGGEAVRFFDFATTKRELTRKGKEGKDPDYTASHLMQHNQGDYYSWDTYAAQIGPAEIDDLLVSTVQSDLRWAHSQRVKYRVRWEEEPGSAGQRETARFVSLLVKKFGALDCGGVPSRVDKASRAAGFASILRPPTRRVYLVKSKDNERYLTHMHHQYDWPHDDEHDATIGSYNVLADYKPKRQQARAGGAKPPSRTPVDKPAQGRERDRDRLIMPALVGTTGGTAGSTPPRVRATGFASGSITPRGGRKGQPKW